jgi:hypothetical protein
MDYFIRQVNRVWYRVYFGWMLFFGVALLGIFGAGEFSPTISHFAGHFGITPTNAILGGDAWFYIALAFTGSLKDTAHRLRYLPVDFSFCRFL